MRCQMLIGKPIPGIPFQPDLKPCPNAARVRCDHCDLTFCGLHYLIHAAKCAQDQDLDDDSSLDEFPGRREGEGGFDA